MEKTAFIATDWVRNAETTTAISRSRTEIQAYLGWGDGWYGDDLSLGLLYDFLQGQLPSLLDDLEQADDDAGREAWIARVAEATRYSGPDWDDNYGLYYRYDKLTQLYEWAESASPEVWMTQAEADEIVRSGDDSSDESHFEEPAPEAPPSASAEASPSLYSEPVWDHNWKMLYRTDQDGVYQYAHSDDEKAIRPGASWLSYDEVQKERAELAQRHATEALAVLAPGNLASLAAELEMDEGLLRELISDLPEDFDLMVHAEVVALDDADE